MEHIPQSQASRFENGAVISFEYKMHEANLNVAPISINGRYPEDGFTCNTVSDSIIYVINGSGVFVMKNGMTVKLVRNDQLHIAIGDEYYFDGTLDIIYAASPPWTPEQTSHID